MLWQPPLLLLLPPPPLLLIMPPPPLLPLLLAASAAVLATAVQVDVEARPTTPSDGSAAEPYCGEGTARGSVLSHTAAMEEKKTKLTFWSSWQVRGAREEKHPPVHSECARARSDGLVIAL
jgi:hypothetical protein